MKHALEPCGDPVAGRDDDVVDPESELVRAVRRYVEDGMDSGLYCAESVALALAKTQGIESDAVARMATAFCSGMSQTCGTCGALTGAVMGVSLALGRSKPGEPVDKCYAATQSLVRAFEAECGARNCSDLLGCDLATPQGRATFRVNGLHQRCRLYTIRAAELAATIIADDAKGR